MKEHIAHSGTWVLALIVIVVVSWLLYRYLAPKTWREWASAGVIQAFIIALYAEMYGFPLTIYLLARFFGLDQTNLNANLWSTLLLARSEDRKVEEQFGDEYRPYRKRVPMFIQPSGQWVALSTTRVDQSA